MFISLNHQSMGLKSGSEIKEYIQPGANQEAELAAALERYSEGHSNQPSNAIKVLENG